MNNKINIVEEIKSRADIADVIGRTVNLKKSGSNWLGLCPFPDHNEKTPSFYVNENSQSYKCFGCGKYGDVIKYYEVYYNISFLEACEKLAKEYGIDWEPGSGYGAESKNSTYYEINKTVARFYYDTMWASENPAYRYMLDERGISVETMRKFGLGYADGGKQKLVKHLESKGISLKDAAEIGVIKRDGGTYRDKFFNRVVFPIINERNKVIGFGGRIIGDGHPKYLNSDASPIFQKKDNLYALNLTVSEIRERGYSILVEGYMDVIALYHHGVKNVTASLGTAFTPDQAVRLKKYANDVVLSFDSDGAGVEATLRSIDILKEKDLKVRVLSMGDSKDPDEYIKQYGKNNFEEVIKKSIPGTAFKLRKAREKYDLNAPEGSINYLKEAGNILKKLPPVEADYYIKELSKDTGIAEGAIKMETFGEDYDHSKRQKSAWDDAQRSSWEEEKEAKQGETQASLALQRNIIRLLIDNNSFISKFEGHERIFSNPDLNMIFGLLKTLYLKDKEEVKYEDLYEKLEPDNRKILEDIMTNLLIAVDAEKQIDDCLIQAELMVFEKQESEILTMLKNMRDDDDLIDKIMNELKVIQDKIQQLRNKL